ncbi:DUF493 domain-containing protein [Bergeyella porcorum]|uniref:DUF493 domain-containing protein n=1 Tax=Bergeyella porcorum TaxID=1735111 RepID=UPI0035E5AC2E
MVLDNNKNPEEFYKNLKKQLDENHEFPEDYLFKFIFPNDNSKLTDLYQIFDKTQYTISTRESKNGKYISASILVFVLDANHVIQLYQEVAKIEGVIML